MSFLILGGEYFCECGFSCKGKNKVDTAEKFTNHLREHWKKKEILDLADKIVVDLLGTKKEEAK